MHQLMQQLISLLFLLNRWREIQFAVVVVVVVDVDVNDICCWSQELPPVPVGQDVVVVDHVAEVRFDKLKCVFRHTIEFAMEDGLLMLTMASGRSNGLPLVAHGHLVKVRPDKLECAFVKSASRASRVRFRISGLSHF